MIQAAAVKEMIELYEKHGWKLRRVLLSDPLRNRLEAAGVLDDAEVTTNSELDAAWFSRSSHPDRTAWEIRHLSETPFALVEVVDNTMNEKKVEEVFNAAEAKMIEITAKRPRAN